MKNTYGMWILEKENKKTGGGSQYSDQLMVYGKFYQIYGISYTEFSHDVFAMYTDSLVADEKFVGDLFIIHCLGNQFEYFLLSFGQFFAE